MRNVATSTSIFAMMFAAQSPAFADDAAAYDDEEPIIVNGQKDGYTAITSSGLKTPTPLIDTPQTVSVVTREQLDDQALQDMGDILRYTPGVSIGQGEGHRDQVTIRGQNTTADFFQDGIRDDVQYFRPLYNIERVEIHKGPNAMIFGRGGGGGAVNRVTKSPLLGESFGKVAASVDSFGSYNITGDVNFSAGNAAIRVNGLYEDFGNHRDFFGGRRFAINPSIGGNLGEKTSVVFSYEYVDDDRTVDRGIPSENGVPIVGFDNTFFGDPDANVTTLKAHILKLRFKHDFTDELSFNSTTSYADYDKLYQNIYPTGFNSAAGTVGLDGYSDTTDRQNFITQGNLLWTGDTGPIGHTLLLGYEYGQQDTSNARRDVFFAASADDQITFAFTDPLAIPAFSFPVFNRNRASDLKFVSLYVQDQIALGDHFDIVAGVRYDSFDISVNDIQNALQLQRTDNKFSPRFGLIYKPLENISIYASYAKSFLPRAGDQFLTLSVNTANLAPESFVNYEIGAKWDIKPNLALTASVFRLDRDNQAVLVNNQGDQVLSGSRTDGFELQLTGQATDKLQINAGYSYLDGEVRDANSVAGNPRQLFQVPQHMASLWARYDFTDQFGAGFGVTHQSSQFARNDNAVRIPAYTRFDAAIFYDVSENLQLQLNVENLTDEDYFPAAHNNSNISTGEPINARLSIRANF